jgi:alanyl-tRNA synthetase
MTSSEIRQSFLDFFASKGHRIVPSAPVIPHGDPTLLFTNAGMNQFKDVFLGTGKRDYTRAADTQKCIRVSGKHNDLEEVGRDTYHHTFFEMLGNWSFGDYYKKEAIGWAWELLTEIWKLPKERLWATVYKTDDEAFGLWKKVTDINPAHVLKFGEKDNFWEMGETGPCGPCSEIHIDLTPDGHATANFVNAGTPKVIEIWNLVFIQNNRINESTLEDLPAKHVDTGMGFERVCAVMEAMKNNFQTPPSNYDSDVFSPLINKIEKISNKEYKRSHSDNDVAIRVIADHVRALTFAIGDGAIPSNEGRGYVLRRILRRAARFGRNIDLREPFLYQLVGTLVETMSHVFPEIKTQQHHIERIIKGEEEGFNQTLDRGLEIFEIAVKDLKQSKVFPGDVAFKLYDTFGFPLDLTELLCKERGLSVDNSVFDNLMEQQRERSRDVRFSKSEQNIGDTTSIATGRDSARSLETSDFEKTSKFVGYDSLEDQAEIVKTSDNLIILSRTPFYAESGGQVGDIGVIEVEGVPLKVIDTQKSGGVNVHILEKNGPPNGRAIAKVNVKRRFSIMRNHTATHLLHEALRRVLGTHLHQQGSLVASDHLRFDINHFEKITKEQLEEVEKIVNGKINENIEVHALNDPKDWITIDEAKRRYPNVKMFFGDKYGDHVRVVEIDPKFSVELCGGTHVKNTREIGFFKIRSEGSSASGIRRIEAITNDYALEYLELQNKSYRERVEYAYQLIDEIQAIYEEVEKLSKGTSPLLNEKVTDLDIELRKLEQIPDLPPTVTPGEMIETFSEQESRFHALENYILMLSERKRTFEKELGKFKVQSAASDIDELVRHSTPMNGFKLVASKIGAADMDALKSLGDALRSKIGSGVGLLASIIDDKVALVCVVSDDLIKTKNIQAGKIVGTVAKTLGGGGGGKPHLATAGGKDVSKLDEALIQFPDVIKELIHSQ